MKKTAARKFLAMMLSLLFIGSVSFAQQLITYSVIPGRTPSTKYTCKVRMLSSVQWQDAFVLQTISQPTANPGNGYTSNLIGWSASWIAFEFAGGPVEVEIALVGGGNITQAMVRPVGSASPALISNGKAYIQFSQPANVNVDINNQMEGQYTGMQYNGPQVHTISLFANPIFQKPNLASPSVYSLSPGNPIPPSNLWDTLYFMPGIHSIGTPYQISSNKVLYLSGDVILNGTIHPPNQWGSSAATGWSIYGSGAISGEQIAWNTGTYNNKPFTRQAAKVRLEGFVVIDPAHHTFNMNNTSTLTADGNTYKNLKILGWRINGDGINAFRNSTITDCFLRTQDDVFYLGNNVKISNCVTWNDFNGSVLYANEGSPTSYFKDIKVIYHRAGWHYWQGGRIISMREKKPLSNTKDILVQNVLVEDPFPAFPPFYFRIINPNNLNGINDTIGFNNIIIDNLTQNHPGVSTPNDANFGVPKNTMFGLDSERKFKNITFKDCYYNGVCLTSYASGNFAVNAYTSNINFTCNTIGFESISNKSTNYTVYPNPFKDKINIVNVNGEALYSLSNTMGQIIFEGRDIDKQNFSDLMSGIYFLRISNQTEIEILKLMKE
jgi:hypothetical protein